MIGLGGFAGAVARYLVATTIQSRVHAGFPWGTFVVNVSGCFVMGIVMTLLTERLVTNPNWRYLIPIGFIGAYTTFSTFEWELFGANTEGAWWVGLAYLTGSVVAGYVALWTGIAIARSV
jgi:fluoride exporter